MVRYNTFYDTYTDMEKALKGKITWLTEKDFSFLKSLYDYKVKSEHKDGAIQELFIKFLKHFNFIGGKSPSEREGMRADILI